MWSIVGGEAISLPRSLELREFRLGLFEDRDVRVGIFPESEELLISKLCLGAYPRQSERPAKFQPCERTDGLTPDDAGVIENLLKLGGGCDACFAASRRPRR